MKRMQDPSLYSQIKAQVQQPQFPEQEHLKCPRCESTNTKFCYYNNYNLSQPRHFCKSCRRYWTKGGALRNIPVGGGSRKNAKRSSSAATSTSSSAAAAAKRPAAAYPTPPSDTKNDSRSKNGEMTENETLQVKGENFVGQFGNLLEAGGSFSSLLGGNGGQFDNFLDGLGPNGSSSLQISDHFGEPGSGQNVDPQVLESGSSNNGDGFLNLQGGGNGGGETGCWNGGSNGWPDLAIYTPGSNFQ